MPQSMGGCASKVRQHEGAFQGRSCPQKKGSTQSQDNVQNCSVPAGTDVVVGEIKHDPRDQFCLGAIYLHKIQNLYKNTELIMSK